MSCFLLIQRAALAAWAAACVTACAAPQSASTPAGHPEAGTGQRRPSCDAQRAAGLVGAQYSSEVAARAAQAAGASTVRVLRPGEVHTMEFVDSRLTIGVDSAGKVRELRCG